MKESSNTLAILRLPISEKLWILTALAGMLVIHAFLISRFTFNLFEEDSFTQAFNSLADSLLQGKVSIPSEILRHEGYTSDGQTVMYFGLFPALLRIPLIVLGYSQFSLGRISCLMAALVFHLAVVVLLLQTSHKKRPDFTFWSLLFTFSLGSPALFLSLWGSIYHECIWWALAWSSWSIVAITRHKHFGSLTPRCWRSLGITAGLCLLSRVTFAIPLILISVDRQLRQICREGLRASVPVMLAWLIPLSIFLAVAGWYNTARYGSPLKFDPGSDQFIDIPALGGRFNIERLPSNLKIYFGLSSLPFSTIAPFFKAYPPVYQRPELFYVWREDVVSLTMIDPLLVGLVIFALVGTAFYKRWDELIVISFFVVQVLLIGTFYFATLRYMNEFMPLLLFGSALMVRHGNFRFPRSLLVTLTLWSIATTIAIGVSWNMKWVHRRDSSGAKHMGEIIHPQVYCPFSKETRKFLIEKTELEAESLIECLPAPEL